jgi:hypothetical protein
VLAGAIERFFDTHAADSMSVAIRAGADRFRGRGA